MSPHGGARVVGDGIEVVNSVVCGEQGQCSAMPAAAPLPHNMPAQSWGREGLAHWMSAAPTPRASSPATAACSTLGGMKDPARSCQEPRAGAMQGLALTAALRGKLPEVQVLQLEVDEGGELARSYPGL